MEKKANSSLATRPTGCFVCNKLHRARDCPKKDEINAFIIVDEDNSESNTHTRVKPLQLLNVIRVETH